MELRDHLHAPSRFTPVERDAGTHWIGGWVDPTAGLETVSKRKTLSPCWDLNPDYPIVQTVVSRYTDWAIQAHAWDTLGRQTRQE
jgi:hypothetical protein